MEQITEQKEIKRFDIKTEAKLLRTVGGLLNQRKTPITEERAVESETISVMDPASVTMLIAKTEEAKRLLSRFKDFDEETKEPTLDYRVVRNDRSPTSKYSIEYLSKIIKIFDCFEGGVEISIRNDYPSTLENDHFRAILAPRVGDD